MNSSTVANPLFTYWATGLTEILTNCLITEVLRVERCQFASTCVFMCTDVPAHSVKQLQKVEKVEIQSFWQLFVISVII